MADDEMLIGVRIDKSAANRSLTELANDAIKYGQEAKKNFGKGWANQKAEGIGDSRKGQLGEMVFGKNMLPEMDNLGKMLGKSTMVMFAGGMAMEAAAVAKDTVLNLAKHFASAIPQAFMDIGQQAAQAFMGGLEALRSGDPAQYLSVITATMGGFTDLLGNFTAGVLRQIPVVGEVWAGAIEKISQAMGMGIEVGGAYIAHLSEIGDQFLQVSRKMAQHETNMQYVAENTAMVAKIMGSGAIDTLFDVSEGISRFGNTLQLAGPRLQEFTQNYASFAEVVSNVNEVNVAGLMKAFAVPQEDMSLMLTRLGNVMRETGGEADRVMYSMINSGPAFRALGYDLDTTALMFGKMTQEGERGTRMVYALNQVVEKVGQIAGPGQMFETAQQGWDYIVTSIKQTTNEAKKFDKQAEEAQKSGNAAAAQQAETRARQLRDQAQALLRGFTTPQAATLLTESIERDIIRTSDSLRRVIEQNSDTYGAPLDEAAEKTTTLAAVFENLQQVWEASVGRMGTALNLGLSEPLGRLTQWMTQNQDTISGWATKLAVFFIDAAEDFTNFAAKLIEGFAGVANQTMWLIGNSVKVAIAPLRWMLDVAEHLPGFLGGGVADALKDGFDKINEGANSLAHLDIKKPLEDFAKEAGKVSAEVFPELRKQTLAADADFKKTFRISNVLEIDNMPVYEPLPKDATLENLNLRFNMEKTTADQRAEIVQKLRAQDFNVDYDAASGIIKSIIGKTPEAQDAIATWFKIEPKVRIDLDTDQAQSDLEKGLDGTKVTIDADVSASARKAIENLPKTPTYEEVAAGAGLRAPAASTYTGGGAYGGGVVPGGAAYVPGAGVAPTGQLPTGPVPGGGLGNSNQNQPGVESAKGIIAGLFPQIQTISGARPDSMPYHREGRALDIMIPDYASAAGKALGDGILKFIHDNYAALGVEDTIWQDTWTDPSNPSTAHRLNRPGDTQGHYDHIHISFTPGSQVDVNALKLPAGVTVTPSSGSPVAAPPSVGSPVVSGAPTGGPGTSGVMMDGQERKYWTVEANGAIVWRSQSGNPTAPPKGQPGESAKTPPPSVWPPTGPANAAGNTSNASQLPSIKTSEDLAAFATTAQWGQLSKAEQEELFKQVIGNAEPDARPNKNLAMLADGSLRMVTDSGKFLDSASNSWKSMVDDGYKLVEGVWKKQDTAADKTKEAAKATENAAGKVEAAADSLKVGGQAIAEAAQQQAKVQNGQSSKPFGPGLNPDDPWYQQNAASKLSAETWLIQTYGGGNMNGDFRLPAKPGNIEAVDQVGTSSWWASGSRYDPVAENAYNAGQQAKEGNRAAGNWLSNAASTVKDALTRDAPGLPEDDWARPENLIPAIGRGIANSKGAQQIKKGVGWLWENMFASGGIVSGPGTGTSDEIPAWLSNGEHVWTAAEVQAAGGHGAVMAMRANASKLPRFAVGGAVDTRGAQRDTIGLAEAVADRFGVTGIHLYRAPDGYNEHSSGQAADFMVSDLGVAASGDGLRQGNMLNLAALALANQFGVMYTIWQNKMWYPGGTSKPYGADPSDATQSHKDHVHARTKGGGFPEDGGPGQFGMGDRIPRGMSTAPSKEASSAGSIRLPGFADGGQVTDEYRNAAEQIAALYGAGSSSAPSIGLPTGNVTPLSSAGAGLGLGPTPNVNAAPGFKAGQNLTDFSAGVSGAVAGNVEGLIYAATNPVETAKALAPLVGAGGTGAMGVKDAWKTLGKAISHWDEWETNPYGAAGGVTIDLGSLLLPGGGFAAATARAGTKGAVKAGVTGSRLTDDLAAAARASVGLKPGGADALALHESIHADMLASYGKPIEYAPSRTRKFDSAGKPILGPIHGPYASPLEKLAYKAPPLTDPRLNSDDLLALVSSGDPIVIKSGVPGGADIDLTELASYLDPDVFVDVYDSMYAIQRLAPGAGPESVSLPSTHSEIWNKNWDVENTFALARLPDDHSHGPRHIELNPGFGSAAVRARLQGVGIRTDDIVGILSEYKRMGDAGWMPKSSTAITSPHAQREMIERLMAHETMHVWMGRLWDALRAQGIGLVGDFFDFEYAFKEQVFKKLYPDINPHGLKDADKYAAFREASFAEYSWQRYGFDDEMGHELPTMAFEDLIANGPDAMIGSKAVMNRAIEILTQDLKTPGGDKLAFHLKGVDLDLANPRFNEKLSEEILKGNHAKRGDDQKFVNVLGPDGVWENEFLWGRLGEFIKHLSERGRIEDFPDALGGDQLPIEDGLDWDNLPPPEDGGIDWSAKPPFSQGFGSTGLGKIGGALTGRTGPQLPPNLQNLLDGSLGFLYRSDAREYMDQRITYNAKSGLFTPDQLSAISIYTGRPMNDLLRAAFDPNHPEHLAALEKLRGKPGMFEDDFRYRPSSRKQIIDDLDSAMRAAKEAGFALPEDMTLIRDVQPTAFSRQPWLGQAFDTNIHPGPLDVEELMGVEFTDPAHMSTSIRARAGMDPTSPFTDMPFQLVLNAPEGTPGLWLGAAGPRGKGNNDLYDHDLVLSVFPHEDEWLLPRGSSFVPYDYKYHSDTNPAAGVRVFADLFTPDTPPKVPGFASGGSVFGAGNATSDSIPAWLSNGEHVWTAAEVQAAGGHANVEALRAGMIPRFVEGGQVAGGQVVNGVFIPQDVWDLGASIGLGRNSQYQSPDPAKNPFINPPQGLDAEALKKAFDTYVMWQKGLADQTRKGIDLTAEYNDLKRQETDLLKDFQDKKAEETAALEKWNALKPQDQELIRARKGAEWLAVESASTEAKNLFDRITEIQKAIKNMEDYDFPGYELEKQRTAMQGPPEYKTKDKKGKGDKDAQDLGKGLITGLLEGMGFTDDVFGESIFEWGIWKKFTQTLGWGLGNLQEAGLLGQPAKGNPLGEGTGLNILGGAAQVAIPGAAQNLPAAGGGGGAPGLLGLIPGVGSGPAPGPPPSAMPAAMAASGQPANLGNAGMAGQGTGPAPGPTNNFTFNAPTAAAVQSAVPAANAIAAGSNANFHSPPP